MKLKDIVKALLNRDISALKEVNDLTVKELDHGKQYNTAVLDIIEEALKQMLPAFNPEIEDTFVHVTKLTSPYLAQLACSYTINKSVKPSLKKLYNCEHSPIRTQLFAVEMINIPSFVSTHFVRHHVGVDHFVKSNREDRNGGHTNIDRNTPVNHLMVCNAQALINMSRRRLCLQAHPQTVKVMNMIKEAVAKVDLDLAEKMVPECEYRNGCHELKPCGRFEVAKSKGKPKPSASLAEIAAKYKQAVENKMDVFMVETDQGLQPVLTNFAEYLFRYFLGEDWRNRI